MADTYGCPLKNLPNTNIYVKKFTVPKPFTTTTIKPYKTANGHIDVGLKDQ